MIDIDSLSRLQNLPEIPFYLRLGATFKETYEQSFGNTKKQQNKYKIN